MKSMLSTLSVSLLLGVFGAQPAAAQAEKAVPTESELPAANALSVEADCDRVNAGLPLAVFNWTVPRDYDGRHQVQVTPYRNGFDSENFEAIGELDADQSTLEWNGGEAGINYYWRVLTRTPDGWVASAIARYEVPTCPVDFERPEKPVE